MAASDIPVIEIEGAYFFKGEERFIVRGIVYQLPPCMRTHLNPRHIPDPLDDSRYHDLIRDVELFHELNINALWVYHHDIEVSHTKCMNLLAENGIYVIFKDFGWKNAINRNRPLTSYTAENLQAWAKMIDSVAPYPNTLGLCVASSPITESNALTLSNVGDCWSVVAKFIRDLKQYMRFRHHDIGQRVLPLTINDSEWSSLNTETFHYFADPDVEGRPANGRVDFYCFYHCGSGMERRPFGHRPVNVGQEMLPAPAIPSVPGAPVADAAVNDWKGQLPMQKFQNAQDPVPVVISEYGTGYGSNRRLPRTFNEVLDLYGKSMSSPLLGVLSGGFTYELFGGNSGYGLVEQDQSGSRKILLDYYNFRNAMHEAVGTSQANIQHSRMTTFNRPVQLILDFDGTLTTKDSLHLVAEAGYRRQRYSGAEPQPAPWKVISKAYECDYTAHEIKYGRSGFMEGSVRKEFEWLDSLSAVESASADRAFDAGIFDNVTMQDMELAAADSLLSRKIDLRPGWSDLLAQVNRINKRTATHMSDPLLLQVISVNWSRWFVWSVMHRATLSLEKSSVEIDARDAVEKLAIYANEVPTVMAEQTLAPKPMPSPRGNPVMLRTANDKLRQMQSNISQYARYIPCPLTIYVGDSATDFECLVMADVGICIGDAQLEKNLHFACEKSGIRVTSLANYRPAERSVTTLDELEKHMSTKEITIYHARDFHEITEWISRFTDDVTLTQPQEK